MDRAPEGGGVSLSIAEHIERAEQALAHVDQLNTADWSRRIQAVVARATLHLRLAEWIEAHQESTCERVEAERDRYKAALEAIEKPDYIRLATARDIAAAALAPSTDSSGGGL